MYECVCMQIFYIYTFIHIYQHTQLHSHIHSYTRTHTRALSLSHTHTNAHGLACTHKLVRAHSLTIDSLFLWPHSMQCRRRGQTTGLSHTNTGRPKTNRCTCNSHGNRTHLARTSIAGVQISPGKIQVCSGQNSLARKLRSKKCRPGYDEAETQLHRERT